tara:strand:+ start:179 stop:400 length:222 start_codon:yes stop_codon:yes gene_type:complete
MKKILSTIVLSSLVTLSISPPVKAHKVKAHVVKSYKECSKYARKHFKMSCSEAISIGLIAIAIQGGNMPNSGE